VELRPSIGGASELLLPCIDSHTAGEPTRWFLDGYSSWLGSQSPVAIRAGWPHSRLAELLTTLIREPRGAAATVGVLTVPPSSPAADLGVVFFNESGCLGMCGHATIGLLVSLHRLGRIPLGVQLLETPVGLVRAELISPRRVRFENVPAGVLPGQVEVPLDGAGTVTGRIAWGGNWFFIVRNWPQPLERHSAAELLRQTGTLLDQLHRAGHRQVDHVVLLGTPQSEEANARSFVLCPNGTYDRSPCGTGTSAWLAVMADERLWVAGRDWIQEGMSGECFRASFQPLGATAPEGARGVEGARQAACPAPATPQIVPTIEGQAAIIGSSQLLVDAAMLERLSEPQR
jgi:4-hydroxyproline epimerase